jgi:hypothetical protein
MGTRKSKKRGNYRMSVRLDLEMDADLINWLESVPKGQRSEALRTIIREGLGITPSQPRQEIPTPDLDAIRFVVADEIRKALKDKTIAGQESRSNQPEHDMEAKYGDKLNRMLGGFAGQRDSPG